MKAASTTSKVKECRICKKGIITRRNGQILRHFTTTGGDYFHNECLSQDSKKVIYDRTLN